ncbi:DinB family protein [Pedobacter gandavensis]|uniref:DinB family protein n=1 Tax=Pedobacter gandavensis TaxID=2679963 RepID=UPI00292E1993|nr:DinB family protein [Pedobacter gandavensis]
MVRLTRLGAKGAMLDVYEDAIQELCQEVEYLTDEALLTLLDPDSKDENCRSIQTILGHVVGSAFSYAIYIQELSGEGDPRPGLRLRDTVLAYLQDLNDAFAFTLTVFEALSDSDLEKFDPKEKIHSRWQQTYDIEQMMEHAIVHVLRHTRQIEKFKRRLEIL